jgi:hypothetical protein
MFQPLASIEWFRPRRSVVLHFISIYGQTFDD